MRNLSNQIDTREAAVDVGPPITGEHGAGRASLRRVKALADAAVNALSPTFDEMYATGRRAAVSTSGFDDTA
jgi:hypothetical protein